MGKQEPSPKSLIEQLDEQLKKLPPDQRAHVEKLKGRIQKVVDDYGPEPMWGSIEFIWEDVKKLIAAGLSKPEDNFIWEKIHGAIGFALSLQNVVFAVAGLPPDAEEEEHEEEQPETGSEEATPAAAAPGEEEVF